jgi:hypothetical protein
MAAMIFFTTWQNAMWFEYLLEGLGKRRLVKVLSLVTSFLRRSNMATKTANVTLFVVVSVLDNSLLCILSVLEPAF